MTSTWTLTATSAAGPTIISGSSASPQAAAEGVQRAARDAIGAAPHHTHYELHVDGQLLAIIDTGLTDDGGPDRSQALALLDRACGTPSPLPTDIAVPRCAGGAR
jgi:hypothetical protein